MSVSGATEARDLVVFCRDSKAGDKMVLTLVQFWYKHWGLSVSMFRHVYEKNWASRYDTLLQDGVGFSLTISALWQAGGG